MATRTQFKMSCAKSSSIIASQLNVSSWVDVIGEETIADAILDGLVHTSYRIEMNSEAEPQDIRKELAANHKPFRTLSLFLDFLYISLSLLHYRIAKLYLHNTHLSKNYLPIIFPLSPDDAEIIVWL